LNDLNTINLLREGNQLGFRMVFDEYHKRVYAYVYKKTGSAYLAEETMQLTFVKLWKYRRSLNPGFALSTQVFRIAGTTMIDLIRKEKNKEHLLKALKGQPEGVSSPDDPFEEKELGNRVRVIVRRMPEMQKKVFEMSRFEEKSHREIALLLSISVKTVENHISRALKFLRQNLNILGSVAAFFITVLSR
jgi:RNA polymerase sigma-70 factor (ECF subfamily)